MQQSIEPEFIVTARKWRPQQFKDVIGQEHITTTLRNAIHTGRIHHAYLFCGPRGVGKTTTARILARAVNCLDPHDNEPCNVCSSCKAILENKSLDIIEIDGASNNSVDDVRKLRENAKYPALDGKYRLYIIDEVHMLTTSAFNALLKILEEPPSHLLFVFATTEPHKVPATILSRCQRFEFKRMKNADIIKQISIIAEKDGLVIDDEAMLTIARKADGSMRDAESLLDQIVAFCGKTINYTEMADALHLIDTEFFFRISGMIREHNLPDVFAIVEEISSKGYDLSECMSGLLEHFRNLLATKVAGKGRFVETTDMFAEKYLKETELFTKADILRLLNIITSTEQALRFAPQPRVRFELGLIQMASLDKSIEIESLLNEIKNFKGGIPAIAEERVQYQPATKPIEPKIQHPVQQEPQKKAPKLDLSVQEVEIPQPKTEAHQIKNIKENNVEAQKLSNSINSGVDAESLRQGWNAFIEKYAYTENGFHILTQSEFFRFEFLNSEVVIYVNSEFAYEQIYRARLNIASFMREFYGGEAKPRILHDDGSQVASNYVSDKGPVKISKPVDNSMSNDTQTKNETSQTAKPAKMQNKQVSEVEQKIIDLFGAREV